MRVETFPGTSTAPLPLLGPGPQNETYAEQKPLPCLAGAFLESGPMPDIVAGLGYAALMAAHEPYVYEGVSFSPNPAYDRYLRMHKVFVGDYGGVRLEEIYNSLKMERMPRYLMAAGWAAVESAIVRVTQPIDDRLALLAGGVSCWQESLKIQSDFNADAADCLVNYAVPYRTALDIAVAPLLAHMIQGYVPKQVSKNVFEDCLNIAQANSVRMLLMQKEGNSGGYSDHLGLGFECNALLSINRPINQRFSATRFAVPSMIRADSGYYHPSQTHDLMVIEQDRGTIRRITPIEIKASATANDRLRYRALLVRGRMHLSEPGKVSPRDTLDIIAAAHESVADKKEQAVVDAFTRQIHAMLDDYHAGDQLEDFASNRGPMFFHDNSIVAQKYPGLLAPVA